MVPHCNTNTTLSMVPHCNTTTTLSIVPHCNFYKHHPINGPTLQYKHHPINGPTLQYNHHPINSPTLQYKHHPINGPALQYKLHPINGPALPQKQIHHHVWHLWWGLHSDVTHLPQHSLWYKNTILSMLPHYKENTPSSWLVQLRHLWSGPQSPTKKQQHTEAFTKSAGLVDVPVLTCVGQTCGCSQNRWDTFAKSCRPGQCSAECKPSNTHDRTWWSCL